MNYTSSREVELQCINSHNFIRSMGHLKQNIFSCPECINITSDTTTKYRVQYLKNLPLQYTVIGDNLAGDLEVKCINNHTFKRPFTDFENNNTNCEQCKQNDIKKYIISRGLKYIGGDFNHNMILRCKSGHIITKSLNTLKKQSSNMCPECSIEHKNRIINNLSNGELAAVNTSIQFGHTTSFICNEGHSFVRGFNNFIAGQTKCPICYPYASSQEVDIHRFLTSLGVKFIHSEWKTLEGKEIDFLLPEHNLGIEYNGRYWHSELMGKDKTYHLNKTIKAKEKNISILHISEEEWLNPTKQNIWKSIIKGKLNLHSKIFARKCIIREVPKEDCYKFLDENHLQGKTGSKVELGLYYNNELLVLMTFGRPRMNKKYNWELIRFASKQGISVTGGASKLFKYFIKNYLACSENILSYSDRRYSEGNMYNKLGFEFSHNSSPNYLYFRGNNPSESRHKFMKHKLHSLLEKYSPELTEWDNMKLNGYNRIWDCGNQVWVYGVVDDK